MSVSANNISYDVLSQGTVGLGKLACDFGQSARFSVCTAWFASSLDGQTQFDLPGKILVAGRTRPTRPYASKVDLSRLGRDPPAPSACDHAGRCEVSPSPPSGLVAFDLWVVTVALRSSFLVTAPSRRSIATTRLHATSLPFYDGSVFR